jgi:hypothetical protein
VWVIGSSTTAYQKELRTQINLQIHFFSLPWLYTKYGKSASKYSTIDNEKEQEKIVKLVRGE